MSFMPSAAQQVKRDQNIRDRRSCGATIADLANEFKLGETRIKQVLKAKPLLPDQWDRSEYRALAQARLEQYREISEEMWQMARDIPIEQASAKTGAYKAALGVLERVVEFEENLGLLSSHKLVNPFG